MDSNSASKEQQNLSKSKDVAEEGPRRMDSVQSSSSKAISNLLSSESESLLLSQRDSMALSPGDSSQREEHEVFVIVEKVVTEIEYVERIVEKVVEVPKIVERKVPSEPIIIEKIIPEYIFKDHIVEKLVYSEPEIVYIDRPVEVYIDRIVEVDRPVEVIKEIIVEKPVEVIREVIRYVTAPNSSEETIPESPSNEDTQSAYPETRGKSSSVTLTEDNVPRSPISSRVTPATENFSNEKFLDEDLKDRMEKM